MHALRSSLAVLATAALALAQAPIRALVVSGVNNHDCEWTSVELARLLEETGRFEVDVTAEPAGTLADAAAIAGYQVFVLDYNGPRWGAAAERNFLDAVRAGTGVSVIHAANNAFPGWVEYEELVALCWREGTGHGRFHTFDVDVVDRGHPITRDMPGLRAHPDELYHRLVPMHGVDYRVLAHAMSSVESAGTGRHEPIIVVREYDRVRVFHTPLGHVWRGQPETRASYGDPQFRRLVARGTEWAATGAVTLDPVPPNTLSPQEREQGFRLLFDGQTTAGWRAYRGDAFPAAGWSVHGGCLLHQAGGGGGELVTTETFADFDLRFEWAVAKGANSGVIYRCTEEEDTAWHTGPEYQILDDGEQPRRDQVGAGALYGLVAAEAVVLKPVGQFNTGRIVVRGSTVEHWLNGVRVLRCDMQSEDWRQRVAASKFADMPRFARASRGHIALQDHGDEVRYRSLRLRVLEGAHH